MISTRSLRDIQLLTPSRIPRGGSPGVYGLVHPVEGSIAYVGISTNMEKRYWVHIRAAKPWGKSPREVWIAEMLAIGLVPPMIALELFLHEKESEHALSVERKWINKLREGGEAWLNVKSTRAGGKAPDVVAMEHELAELRKHVDLLKQKNEALTRLTTSRW